MKSGTTYSRSVMVVGTTFRRADADEFVIARADVRDIKLRFEPTNPYDTNAIEVIGTAGEYQYKIGYVPAPLAARIAEDRKAGRFAKGIEGKLLSAKFSPKRGGHVDIYFDILDPEPVILLTPKRYAELIESEIKLNALEANGVDNWDGYDDSMTEASDAMTAEEMHGDEQGADPSEPEAAPRADAGVPEAPRN